ncbi:MAG: DsrE family protein [Burkholderiales bacterium]
MSRRHFLAVLSSLSVASVAAAQSPSAVPPAAPVTDAAKPAKLGCLGDPNADHPKAVFQVSKSDDVELVLRVVGNYLVAEPTVEVHVVGYSTGIDFMLTSAADDTTKKYAAQMRRLADRGVRFKCCNNTLKGRNLTPEAVDPLATVVPSAVIEILRLQTHEKFAYFRA